MTNTRSFAAAVAALKGLTATPQMKPQTHGMIGHDPGPPIRTPDADSEAGSPWLHLPVRQVRTARHSAEPYRKGEVKVAVFTINTENPDPTQAINAFLHCMNKCRSLGMMPKTEHSLAEHLFRADVKVMFYSSMGGVVSIVMDQQAIDDFDDDDMFDFVVGSLKRRSDAARKRKAEAAQGIEARSAETSGSAEGESPTR